MTRRVWIVALAVLACSDDLPRRSEVTRLRVLAVRALLPSLRPDASTRIEALVADPDGEGRPLVASWTACVNPPAGDALRCLGREDAWTLPQGLQTTLQVPPRRRPSGDATLGVVLHVCAGAVLEGAVPPVCEFVDTTLDGEDEVAVKKLVLSTQPSNSNPVIEGVFFGGEEVASNGDGLSIPSCTDACPWYRVSVRPTDESDETFRTETGEVRREMLSVAFAADGGELSRAFVSGEDLHADFSLPAGVGQTRFWVVLHDERGGVDFDTFLVATR